MTASTANTDRSRRRFLAGSAAAAAAAGLGFPAILRAQTKELVVGGAASMAPIFREHIFPIFEKKYNVKILFEGTRSLVNLEKMRANKAKPTMSVVLMDDPVMIIADDEGLLDKMNPGKIPNLAKLTKGTVHRDGKWANYQIPWAGIAYNTKRTPGGFQSWTEMWDPKYKGKVILPSLQNTEGVWSLFMAAHLETGKPLEQAQYDIDAAFRKLKALKPNILTVYTNAPQALNLLETGEAAMIGGQFSSIVLPRGSEGAPVSLAAPKEGAFNMPAGICKVANAPNPELTDAFINEYLGPEYQAIMVVRQHVLPTNPATKLPAGFSVPPKLFGPDWAFISKERAKWVERWNREMGA
jgi:putative spermidine/putrescine transport system substrate-binding protein